MNREQAGNILDAYVSLKEKHDGETEAINALRKVILDAMVTFKPATGGIVTTPYIGHPLTNSGTFVGVDYPKDWDGTPKVTCTGIKVTSTGIEPMFGHTTSASTVCANGHTQEAVE